MELADQLEDYITNGRPAVGHLLRSDMLRPECSNRPTGSESNCKLSLPVHGIHPVQGHSPGRIDPRCGRIGH